jgi:hypothetical protein
VWYVEPLLGNDREIRKYINFNFKTLLALSGQQSPEREFLVTKDEGLLEVAVM